MIRHAQIEITQALTIELLNWIEDVDVLFIKDQLIEFDWNHVYHGSNLSVDEGLSVVLG